MTRKYQKIMRSTTAFLEMKESDILNLGQNASSSNQLPKHIVPPYPQNNISQYSMANSPHLYPHICDVKITEDQPVINHRVTQLNSTNFKNFCLLSERNKEMEKEKLVNS